MAEQNATNTATSAIGEVQAVTGRVIAIGADGVERQLFAGDPVYADDQIKTVGQSTIVVALKDGTRFDLGRDSEAVLDEAVYSDDVAAVREAALADIEEIQRMILEGADPTEITEEPAAGGDQGSGGESLQEAVGLDRTGRVGVVEAGYETRGLEQSIDPLVFDPVDFGLGDDTGATAGAVVPLTLTVSAPDNSSDTTPTISGTTNAPVDSTVSLIVTDSAADVQSLFATVQPDGSYSVEVPFVLPEGDYTVEARVIDDEGNTADASDLGSVNAVPENDNPVAVDDVQSVAEDAAATVIDVLANDTDLEGDTLSVDSVTQPANGTVTLIGGVVSYTPDADFHGSDSFTYTLSDGNGGTDTATVSLTVTPENDNPVAVDDSATTDEDNVLNDNVPAASDVDGTIAGYALASDAALGNLVFNPDGSYSFDPGSDFDDLKTGESRDVPFTYTATDNEGGVSAPATVTITVTGTNDAPMVDSNTITVSEESVDNSLGLAIPIDPEGDALTITVTGLPTLGIITLANGTAIVDGQTLTAAELSGLQYDAPADYNGTDDVGSFTYTVDDGTVSVGGSTDINVNPTLDAPTLSLVKAYTASTL